MVTTSLVICTSRHPLTLVDTLARVRAQAPLPTEVLLVRSGVDPGAPLPAPIAETVTRLQISVLSVEAPGVARARQAGLEQARSDIVVFLDDDVLPQEGWFEAITAAMVGAATGAAGGTIHPAWPGGRPPPWAHPTLATYFGEREAGPGNPHLPFGANMAVRRAPALEVGGFSVALGHQGARSGLHEETDLCHRLRALELEVVEAPGAVVAHDVRPEQVRLPWVWRRAWGEGRSDAARDHLSGRADRARRTAKLAGLVVALPLAILPRWRAVIPARALVNLGYLTARPARTSR